MPAMDPASHADREDLKVLRDALGPATGVPAHAHEMRAAAMRKALDAARIRRLKDGIAERLGTTLVTTSQD